MKTLHSLAALALSASFVIAPTSGAAPGASGDRARVYVVYKDGQRGNAAKALAMAGAEVHYDFAGLRGYAVSVPIGALQGLAHNPSIEYVEEDPKRYLLGETTPYGIAAVQADKVGAPSSTAASTEVCIIDSGYDLGHDDLPTAHVDGHSDPGGAGDWYKDALGHGTHVAGTIAATGGNLKGVIGVLPAVGSGASQVSLYIVKVFDGEAWAYSSSLVDALNQCTTHRGSANLVVSMSLGGTLKSRFEDSAFASAYNTGHVISVAAAGNDGNSRNSYPASYSSVISVAAIDEAMNWATFSQYNSQVELAAPGVAVLSTVPMDTGTSTIVSVGSFSPDAEAMDGSFRGTGVGTLVDCGDGTSACSAKGQVCLIQRGTNTFAEKVQNCQTGGGTAAIIYNNVAGPLLGTLGGVTTGIPSVGVSDADGATLMANYRGASTTVSVAAGDYAKYDGTSMATPHVSGVAALVWSHNTSCTNAQIRSALDSTALDRGAAGRDVYYGYGLVQAEDAVVSLGANCGGSSGGGGGGSSGGGGGKGGGKKP